MLGFEDELSAGKEELDWNAASTMPSGAIVVKRDKVAVGLVTLSSFPSGKDDCLFAFTPGELARLHFIHWDGLIGRVG